MIQPLSLTSDYPLSSDQECIDHLGAHAHHTSFSAAGGVPDQLRRDGALGQSTSSLLQSLPSGNGVRYMTHRPAAHEAHFRYQTGAGISDSNSGSISTSPSSNASSLAFSPFSATSVYSSQPTLSLANPYSTGPQIFANYSQPFGMSNMRPRISSITDHSGSGMLPPSRSPGMGNPVSPSLGSSARDNYTTATPGLHRHTLSPRSHADSLSRGSYTSLPDTPRTSVLPTTMTMSPSAASQYGSTATLLGYPTQQDRQAETPPFNNQETFLEITCDGQIVNSHIDAKIEKGFFFSSDRVWTCYRRNYFSVQVSYSLNPHIPNGRLYLNRGSKQPEQIQSIAMSLSAAVDAPSGKPIELIQHTPKRDKGPQLPIKKELLSPAPPGKSQHEHAYGMAAYQHTASTASPCLPLQNDGEQSQHFSPAGHASATHQHTFERIQFKSATANNGKRRAQQQYYHLVVELWANIQNPRDQQPTWVKVAQRVSQPVVVRGRSPSHYQNEGPHSAGTSRGPGGSGSGNGSGHPSFGGSGIGGSLSRGFNGLSSSMSGGTGMGGGMYRSNQYSLDPSPAGSHSVSSASSLSGGPVEGLVGDQHMMDEDESKAIEGFDGYQYYPSPIYEAGIPPGAKAESSNYQDGRRIKEEYPGSTSTTGWHVGSCGRFQGMETSRGYYPDLHAHAGY